MYEILYIFLEQLLVSKLDIQLQIDSQCTRKVKCNFIYSSISLIPMPIHWSSISLLVLHLWRSCCCVSSTVCEGPVWKGLAQGLSTCPNGPHEWLRAQAQRRRSTAAAAEAAASRWRRCSGGGKGEAVPLLRRAALAKCHRGWRTAAHGLH